MNDSFEVEYKKLNADQQKAVDTIEGPVLVIAGPGTGKTQVLALRIANILKQTQADPKSVLCLTFQDASVLAMKSRLQRFIGSDAYKVQVHTFHSFCSEIIRTFPYLFDFSDNVEPIKDIDKLDIFKEILESESLVNLQMRGDILGYYKGIVSSISSLKKEFITPEKLLFQIENFKQSLDEKSLKLEQKRIEKLYDLQKFYKKYLEVMQEKNLIDFDDMIFKVTQAFSINDELVQYFQERYLYTLVDEFQDTNSAQLEVLRTVASFADMDANVFAVGDDDQTIFRFQGASSHNFAKFLELFPKSEIIVLHTNYRSKQEIIDGASNLIENNLHRLVDTEFFSERNLNKDFSSGYKTEDKSNGLEIHSFEHSFHEDYWIGQKILEFAEQNIPLNQIAIISRTNRQITNITKFLDKFGIPYQIKRSESLLESRYIKDLLLIIKVIANPKNLEDDSMIWKILALDFWGLNTFDVFTLYHKAKKEKISIYQYIKESKESEFDGIRELLNKFMALQFYAESNLFSATFTKIIHTFDLVKFFEKGLEPFAELNRISSLYQYIQSRTQFVKDYKISNFLREVTLMSERNINLPIDPIYTDLEGKVNILTAHSAKGLEFQKVFIYQTVENKWEKIRGANDGIKLPPLEGDVMKPEDDALSSEIDERRLFYVSVTRGKDSVFFTYSKRYFDSESGEVDTTEKIASRFLFEIKSNNFFDHKDLVQKHEEITKVLLQEEIPIQVPEKNKDYLSALIKQNLTLSASKINKYQKCHYKFLLEDIYKVPVPESANAFLGTLVHDGIETMHKRYESGNLNETQLNLIIDDLIHRLENKIQSIDLASENTSYEVVKKDLEKSLRIYYSHFIANPVKRVRSEQWIRGEIEGVKVNGRIDMISESNEGLTITDFKTSQHIPSITEFLGLTKNSDKSYLRQVLFYKLLIENSENYYIRQKSKQITRLRIEYIDLKDSAVKIFEIPSGGLFEYKPRSNSKNTVSHDIDSELEELKKDIKDTFQLINGMDFARTKDRSLCQYCPFKEHCGR